MLLLVVFTFTAGVNGLAVLCWGRNSSAQCTSPL